MARRLRNTGLGHYPMSVVGLNPQADTVKSAESITLGMQW